VFMVWPERKVSAISPWSASALTLPAEARTGVQRSSQTASVRCGLGVSCETCVSEERSVSRLVRWNPACTIYRETMRTTDLLHALWRAHSRPMGKLWSQYGDSPDPRPPRANRARRMGSAGAIAFAHGKQRVPLRVWMSVHKRSYPQIRSP